MSLLVIVLYVALTAALFILTGIRGAVFGLFFIGIYFFAYMKQRKRINNMTQKIDEILHGNEVYDICQYTEGELSILENEIRKMTIRLNEQADALLQDKIYLADSVANISHQIRTPMTSINLVISFLKEEKLPLERRMALLNQLDLYMERIDWLVTTLLKISKLDTGTVKFVQNRIDVKEMINKALVPFEIMADVRNISIKLDVEDDLHYEGDMQWSVEALDNLIKNCFEHMDNDGELVIQGRNTAIYTEIVIKDNGCGFDKKDIQHIFERFYRGNQEKCNNFGIGLALAQMIIKKQDGTLKAMNREDGVGAQFVIRMYKSVL